MSKIKRIFFSAMCLMAVCLFVMTAAALPQTGMDWYFKPTNDHTRPQAAAGSGYLAKYGAFYLGEDLGKDLDKAEEKVIYLTFDGGFDKGTTAPILDALRDKNVKAAFFLTGNVIDSCPELVKRMADEGHLVCNHTMRHKDMSKITDFEEFKKELSGVEDKYKALTGMDMPKFYRPPMGRFSEENLKFAQDMGYRTVFWSFAYVDWYEDKQPSEAEAMEKILSRTHNGAVMLLHSTSATNAKIMPRLIDKWISEGYKIEPLTKIK